MSKIAIKETLKKRQNNKDALSGVKLPEDHKLWDTDRIKPKAEGGQYVDLKNVRGLTPVEHMKRHGNYKEREAEFSQLKTLIDGRQQIMKLRNSFSNRLLAYERYTDELDENTQEWLGKEQKDVQSKLTQMDKRIVKHLKSMKHPIIGIASNVKGLGPITIAYMLVYIDIEKATYAGNLWSYVGIIKPSYQRYEKNISGGGNKTLRTVLYTMADSMIKTKGAYRDVYDKEKLRLSRSKKLVESRNTQGKLITCEWRNTKPSHRHGAAIRKMMKHFLADWWLVHRTLEGLDTPQPYVIERLGHHRWIEPQERGWNYISESS